MATLSVAMHSDSVVRIKPIGEITESDWEAVVRWWSIGSTSNGNSTYVDVSLSDFNQRKLWLRENWKSLGNDLVFDEGIKHALKNIEGLMVKFSELSQRDQINIDQFDFDMLIDKNIHE